MMKVSHVDLSSPVFVQGGVGTTSKFPAQGMKNPSMTWDNGHVFYSFENTKGVVQGVLPNSILGNVTFAESEAKKPQVTKK